ncbi:hypothetical protein V3C99_007269, partial [Haemonchus contortus]
RMHANILPDFYRYYYIVIPTISLIGNSAIVYVTVRSKFLRNPCNILIGLISLGELSHMLAHYVMIGFYNNTQNHLMRQDFCVYWQILPTMGMFFSSILLLNAAVDRVISTQKLYISLIKRRYTLYISIHIAIGLVFAFIMETWIFFRRTSEILKTEKLHNDLFAELFVNFACATNFFVYYFI